jgi:DNA-binding NtrC family response regulator
MDHPEVTFTTTMPLRSSRAISLGQERQVTLLVYHRHGVEAAPLAEGQRVVVGRDPAVTDLPVLHPGLSRAHASFELIEDEIWVEDLGSTNLTRLNGEPVTRARVEPEDELRLGGVTASIHVLSPAEGTLQGLLGHDRFLRALDEEILRHQTFSRSLGLILVRALRPETSLSRWCPQVQRDLRPVDRLGFYSRSAVEIVLPEATQPLLDQIARSIGISSLQDQGGPTLVCGTALFPQAATTAAGLLEVARTASQRASASQPVIAAPTTTSYALRGVEQEAVIHSEAMEKVWAVVERMRRSTIPVLILGETGSGKEVVARAIVAGDEGEGEGEAERELPCINCAAIPDQLIESIMFGHEKGAFTGADRQTRGVFEEADGKAVLLDEIGELSPAAQAALLRVLDTKRVTRVGSTKEIPVEVRVLAATHRNLEAMCEAGTFRRDLLYRINTMTLRVPPLRERAEEIQPLAEHFLAEANAANEHQVDRFAPEVLDLLRRYRWPGNVRELRNVIHRAAVMAEGEIITLDDLPERIRSLERSTKPALSSVDDPDRPLKKLLEDDEELDYKTRIQRYEIRLIRAALEESGWSKTKAAQRLRIPLRTLIYKVQSFGIVKEE